MRRVILYIILAAIGFAFAAMTGCASESSPGAPTSVTSQPAAAPVATTRVDPPNAREVLDRERAEFDKNYAAAGTDELKRYEAYLKFACKMQRSEMNYSENTYAAVMAYLRRDFLRDYNATTLESEMNSSCGLPQYQ